MKALGQLITKWGGLFPKKNVEKPKEPGIECKRAPFGAPNGASIRCLVFSTFLDISLQENIKRPAISARPFKIEF